MVTRGEVASKLRFDTEKEHMKKLPRLSDLYVVGRQFDVRAETPDGEVVIPVYVQKLNPKEHDECIIAANAKRSVVLALKRMHDREEKPREYNAIQADLQDLAVDRTNLIDYLALTKVLQYKQRRVAEVAATEEWSEDRYYYGLVESWTEGGLEERYSKNPDDPEAKRVAEELERFDEQVNKLVAPERDRIVRRYLSMSDESLVAEATDRLIENAADAAWITEFRTNQIYFTIRDPESKERYFETVNEVRETDPRIIGQLTEAIESLEVDPVEGKESQESTSS